MANHKRMLWHILVVVSVTLIALCALCASVNAGVSPDVGRNIYPGDSVVIGETNLSFFNGTGVFISDGVLLSDWADSHVVIPFSGFFDSSRYEDELLSGPYVIRVVDTDESAITFVSPKLDITTEVNGEKFGWVTRGGDITFNADTNMWIINGSQPNYISYKLLDPRGKQVSTVNGVSLSDINVGATGMNTSTIDTTGMRAGTYTLSIETDPNTNNGLDTEGPEVSFEVRTNGVTIETTDTQKKTVTEDIAFIISTTPHTNVTVNVTWGRESKVAFDAGGTFDLGLSDAAGTFNTSATFADSGDYEITATEDIRGTSDSIYVEIAPYEVELEADEAIYHIGTNVEISGSATAGDSITLKIDDEVVKTGLAVEGFDYTWETENLAPDSYKIALWVLPFSDPFNDPPDASIYLVLIRGGLFVETSVDFVALGDDFKIEGTVPGRDRVDILTIAPDGGSKGFDPDDIYEETNHKLTASRLTYATSGVNSDGEFETEAIAVGENVDTGTYLIAALNYGRDVEWGNSNNGTLLYVISNDYTTALGAKTTDEFLAILKDKTINAAGTDDLLGITTLKVEKGFVTLDELENVPLGEDLTITGTTNRKVEIPIIITVEGLDEMTPKLKPKVAKVTEDDGRFYNTFEVSFDTASTNIGTYEVTADDGEGHISSTIVNILPAEELSVGVSTTPIPETGEGQESETKAEEGAKKPTTSTPAQAPEETAEQPGFELLFSIFGLLIAVAVVVGQRQKKHER